MRSFSLSRLLWPALAAMGLVAVAIPSALAFEAWRAAERHRQAAERALRDYAGSAADTYRQRVVARLYVPATAVLRPVGLARAIHGPGPLPPVSALRDAAAAAATCDCGPAFRPTYFFRLDLADSSLEIDGASPTAERRRWLMTRVASLGPLWEWRDWDVTSAIDTLDASPQMVYLTIRRGPDAAPRAIYGYAVDVAHLREDFLRPPLSAVPLLSTAPRDRLHNDSLLSVALVDSTGRARLELSPRPPSPRFAVTIPGGMYLGGWDIRLALDPETAPAVLVGGLPPVRTGLLVLVASLAVIIVGLTILLAWRAAQLARLRAEFVASVSHELRTPLAQILLFGETLVAGRMRGRDDVRSAAGVIVGEARRLMQLLENVLHFGRSPRRLRMPAPTRQPVAPIVRGVVAWFEPLAESANATVRLAVVDEISAPVDALALRQILANLLDNAVKYGPRGQQVTVGLELVEGRARLWVEDEGPGIPPTDRERVWRPFVRLSRDVDAQIAGSGIGLSIVRDLVERHGGDAWVEPGVAAGACVVVELPGAEPPPALEPQATCTS